MGEFLMYCSVKRIEVLMFLQRQPYKEALVNSVRQYGN